MLLPSQPRYQYSVIPQIHLISAWTAVLVARKSALDDAESSCFRNVTLSPVGSCVQMPSTEPTTGLSAARCAVPNEVTIRREGNTCASLPLTAISKSKSHSNALPSDSPTRTPGLTLR